MGKIYDANCTTCDYRVTHLLEGVGRRHVSYLLGTCNNCGEFVSYFKKHPSKPERENKCQKCQGSEFIAPIIDEEPSRFFPQIVIKTPAKGFCSVCKDYTLRLCGSGLWD